jgi:hypothetical protein
VPGRGGATGLRPGADGHPRPCGRCDGGERDAPLLRPAADLGRRLEPAVHGVHPVLVAGAAPTGWRQGSLRRPRSPTAASDETTGVKLPMLVPLHLRSPKRQGQKARRCKEADRPGYSRRSRGIARLFAGGRLRRACAPERPGVRREHPSLRWCGAPSNRAGLPSSRIVRRRGSSHPQTSLRQLDQARQRSRVERRPALWVL